MLAPAGCRKFERKMEVKNAQQGENIETHPRESLFIKDQILAVLIN